MKEMSMQAAREMAERALMELSGVEGDPSKRANWIRERQLAQVVVVLLSRIEDLNDTVAVR